MVNPQLFFKQDNPLLLTEDAKQLFRVIFLGQKQEEGANKEERLNVSDLISKMSFYYEKIRNSVDYKEENLLRKNAIERILKREIVIQGTLKLAEVKGAEVARHVLVELIRAGYLPNNQIPESKIGEIGGLIDKYILLKKYSLIDSSIFLFAKKFSAKQDEVKTRGEIINWILSIAASDIEFRLGRNEVNAVVIREMFDTLSHAVRLPGGSPYSDILDVQIYLAVHRNFLKSDESMLTFELFKYFVGGWETADTALIEKTGKNIGNLRRAIDFQLHHGLAAQINRIASRYTVFFSILVDVLKDDPEKIYNEIKKDPKAFPRLIKKICEIRYKNARAKLWRAAIRSMIYILLTKSLLVLILEIPITAWFGQQLNLSALLINISFPALLLFLAVLFTKIPGNENTAKIIAGINRIMFVNFAHQEEIELKKPVKREGFMNFVFGLLYIITFFVSFGFIVWILKQMNFNWVSILIFLFFLAFVSFFALRIRRNTKELLVIEPKENIISLLSDFFYVPIIFVGKWMSEHFSKINVFVFFLDFIIEAPFKIFVEVAEDWTRYVKERRDQIS
jgi:hypothetical protein